MDLKGDLKNWLHSTGRDIAKAVGSHIKERGISYAKEQLGLGLTGEMSGAGYEAEGDGLGDWLKESGSQVASAVGQHLKK